MVYPKLFYFQNFFWHQRFWHINFFYEINYIESFSDYLKIYLNDKIIITRETITNIEAKLPTRDFIRIHRSFIVSMSKVASFTNEFIEVNNKAIPISRSYKKDVLTRLENV